MRQWRNRVERLEDVIASASLLLRFRNGSTELLPIGSEIELLIDLLREQESGASTRSRKLLRKFGRSVPEPDEGSMTTLLREIGRDPKSGSPASLGGIN